MKPTRWLAGGCFLLLHISGIAAQRPPDIISLPSSPPPPRPSIPSLTRPSPPPPRPAQPSPPPPRPAQPSPPPPDPIRILIGGDFHIEGGGITTKNDNKTIEFVKEVSASTTHGVPAAFVMMGDLVDGPDASNISLQALIEAIHVDVPRMVIFGNHDGDNRALSMAQLRAAELDVDHGTSLSFMDATNGTDGLLTARVGTTPVQLVGLDSGGVISTSLFVKAYDTVPAHALNRLFHTVHPPAVDSPSCTLAFIHIPPCEVAGMIETDDTSLQWRGDFIERVSPSRPNRRSVWNVLMDIGAKHIFAGHDHCNIGSVTTPNATFYNTGRSGYGAYTCSASPAPKIVDIMVQPDTCEIVSIDLWDATDGGMTPYPTASAQPPSIAPSHQFRLDHARIAFGVLASGYFSAMIMMMYIIS